MILALLLACGGSTVDTAAFTPCERLAWEVPEPTVEVGTGTETWEPLPDVLEIVQGPQGGWHVYGSLKVQGLLPGNPDLLTDPDNPIVDFTVVHEGEAVGGYTGLPRPLSEQDDGTGTLVGEVLILFVDSGEQLSGETVELSASIQDACGRSAGDSGPTTLHFEPPTTGGTTTGGTATGGTTTGTTGSASSGTIP